MKPIDLIFALLFLPAAPWLLFVFIWRAMERRAHKAECHKWQVFGDGQRTVHEMKAPIWAELSRLEHLPNTYDNQQRRAGLSRMLAKIDEAAQ